MGAGGSGEALVCPDKSVPRGRPPTAKAEQWRLELDGVETQWWGGHAFSPAKSGSFKPQPCCPDPGGPEGSPVRGTPP